MTQSPDPGASSPDSDDLAQDPESYGSLSIEDDLGGTVDPADLAGTASEDDDPVAYAPKHSEADDPED